MNTSNAVNKANFCYSRFFALAFLFLTSIGAASSVIAQQTDADFSAYCRANFNNSAYQRFAQSWGTEHACVQGGTRQGIDMAAACLLTTGSRNYEISGQRVLCEGNAGDAPAANADDTGEPDFSRYCNESFPNSAYETRAESSGVKHYCRRQGATGGFTMQPVDLAVACQISQGVSQYRVVGARVYCTAGNNGGGGNPEPTPTPEPELSPVPAEQPNVPTPENPVIANPDLPDDTPKPNGPGEAVVCQTLGGKWHSGTLSLIDEIIEIKKYEISRCIDSSLCQQIKVERSIEAYMKTLMIYQCHQFYFMEPSENSAEDIALATQEACEIEPILNDLLEQAQDSGAFIPPLHYLRLDAAKTAKICDCRPEGPPDFAARVEELKQQAEQELLAEFSE